MMSLLHHAAQCGDLERSTELICQGEDVNAQDDENQGTPLHWAVVSGQPAMVSLLLENGADVEALDGVAMTPLMLACQTGMAEIIPLLVGAGANINAYNFRWPPAISLAAVEGEFQAVKRLVELGADVHLQDRIGRTPLFWAVGGGLRAAGPNPDFYSREKTAGRMLATKLLIERGAVVERATLEEAAHHRFVEIYVFLMEEMQKADKRYHAS